MAWKFGLAQAGDVPGTHRAGFTQRSITLARPRTWIWCKWTRVHGTHHIGTVYKTFSLGQAYELILVLSVLTRLSLPIRCGLGPNLGAEGHISWEFSDWAGPQNLPRGLCLLMWEDEDGLELKELTRLDLGTGYGALRRAGCWMWLGMLEWEREWLGMLEWGRE